MHLADMVMIKDNHIALSGVSLPELIARVRRECPGIPVACEADTLAQVEELAGLPIDLLMLDNMPPATVRRATKIAGGRISIEVTGGVTLATARAYAEAGADRLSIGALTHSAGSVDLGIDAVDA
jgi:nicotinate-nucleotide pyrophosphorylase (carboxylating)